MRLYLYLLAGATSALIGWNLGQLILSDLNLLTEYQEIVLFPCVAVAIAIGTILNEIFIGNPPLRWQRVYLSASTPFEVPILRWRRFYLIAGIPLAIAVIVGTLLGSLTGVFVNLVVIRSDLPIKSALARFLGWLVIGLSVGISEGISWWWSSLEARDPDILGQRMTVSILGGAGASLIAAWIFELIRRTVRDPELAAERFAEFRNWEDPLGFTLLGLLLGLFFWATNSPSYVSALRAGTGFEHRPQLNLRDEEEEDEEDEEDDPPQATIKPETLRFVGGQYGDRNIEEGLSIRLPNRGKILIGSQPDADICLPRMPELVAELELRKQADVLKPQNGPAKDVTINDQEINAKGQTLKHNDFVTFHTHQKDDQTDEEKIYRFVYYNRFLDPSA